MICPVCMEKIPDNSRFCNMCGCELEKAQERVLIERMNNGEPLIEKRIYIDNIEKIIQVYCMDITDFHEQVDVLTISAFPYSYYPTERSVIGALYRKRGIMVSELAESPYLDLRGNAGCWLSSIIENNQPNIGGICRIGGVENPIVSGTRSEEGLIASIKSYFHLLDISSAMGVCVDTVLLPLLGSGDLRLNASLMGYPLVNEAVSFLMRNQNAKRIVFVERNDEEELAPSFKYYLSRIQWNYGNIPPVEKRVEEFLDKAFTA